MAAADLFLQQAPLPAPPEGGKAEAQQGKEQPLALPGLGRGGLQGVDTQGGHALLGVIVWVAIAALRQLSDAPRNDRRDQGRSRAIEMLEQAYAKGSIGRDEFLQKKQDSKPKVNNASNSDRLFWIGKGLHLT